MAEATVETPTPAEQLEIVFKTNEEKAAALTKVSDEAESIPSGKTADEWQAEVDNRVKKIQEAKVGEPEPKKPAEVPAPVEATQTPAPTPVVPTEPAPATPQPWEKLLEGVQLPEGVQPPKTADAALRAFVTDQQHIAYLKRERIPQIENQYKPKLRNYRNALKTLRLNLPLPCPATCSGSTACPTTPANRYRFRSLTSKKSTAFKWR